MIAEFPWLLLIPVGIFFLYVYKKIKDEDLAEQKVYQLKARAEADLKAQAEAGNPEAQYQVGLSCFTSEHGGKDLESSVKWFRLAAEQGLPSAQCALGARYQKGEGIPVDLVEAVKWFQQAAQGKDLQAYFNLAACYTLGTGVPEDLFQAEKYLRLAIEVGSTNATSELETLLASESYRLAKDPLLQVNRATAYFNGEGVPKDLVEAVKLYSLAADQGNATAQNCLGRCYSAGEGVPKDPARAFHWIKRAAEQGLPVAQGNLGKLYITGEGCTRDPGVGMMWIDKGAGQGDEASRDIVSRCHNVCEGVRLGPARALRRFRVAEKPVEATAPTNFSEPSIIAETATPISKLRKPRTRKSSAIFRSDEPNIILGEPDLESCCEAFGLRSGEGWDCALIAKYLGNPDFLAPLEDRIFDLLAEDFEPELVGYYCCHRIRAAEKLSSWKREARTVQRERDKQRCIQDELNIQRFNMGLEDLPRRVDEDWSDEEDIYLKYRFKQGLSIDYISSEHERTSYEVKRRLTLLDLYKLNRSSYQRSLNSGLTLLDETGWPIDNIISLDYWENPPHPY